MNFLKHGCFNEAGLGAHLAINWDDRPHREDYCTDIDLCGILLKFLIHVQFTIEVF